MAKGTGSGSSNGHNGVFGGPYAIVLAVFMCTIGLPMLIVGSVLISSEETLVAGICILVSALVFATIGLVVIMGYCCYVQQKPPGSTQPLPTATENDLRPSVSVIRVQESQLQPSPSLDGYEYLPKPPEYRHSPPPYEDEDGHPTTTTELAYDGITSIDATASVLRPPTYTSLHR